MVNVEFNKNTVGTFQSGHQAEYSVGNLYRFESAVVSGPNQVTLVHSTHGKLSVSLSDCIVYGDCPLEEVADEPEVDQSMVVRGDADEYPTRGFKKYDSNPGRFKK